MVGVGIKGDVVNDVEFGQFLFEVGDDMWYQIVWILCFFCFLGFFVDIDYWEKCQGWNVQIQCVFGDW